MKPILSFFLLFSLLGCQSTTTETSSPDSSFQLYLLMGQSNMAGRGEITAVDTITHPRVFMLDKDINWVPARDPMHFDKPIAGTGPGLTFGKLMAEAYTSIRIGLIPCAKGGSSINQWFRDSLHEATNSYPYNEMIDKARRAMKDGVLKGILWHQGETDAHSEEQISAYPARFHAMLDSLEKDLEIEPIPVVMGELGYFLYDRQPEAEAFNAMLTELVREEENISLISVQGLGHKGDSIHFNTDAYHEMGKRYAEMMRELLVH